MGKQKRKEVKNTTTGGYSADRRHPKTAVKALQSTFPRHGSNTAAGVHSGEPGRRKGRERMHQSFRTSSLIGGGGDGVGGVLGGLWRRRVVFYRCGS